MSDAMSDSMGVRLESVDSAGPAYRQGFRTGDVLVSWNATRLTRANTALLRDALRRPAPIRVTIRRADETRILTFTPEVVVP